MGNKLYWTYDECKNVALGCETLKEFRINFGNAYKHSRKNGWLSDFNSHMKPYVKTIYWTKERCQKEANKYKNRTDFNKNSSKAYAACVRNKWLDDVCSHMNISHSSSFKWNKEKCAKIALKYKFRKEFQINNKNAYSAAKYNGWLDEICQHMQYKKLPNKYWHSFDNCKNKALEYKTKTDFIKNAQHVYNISLKNGWIDKICKHMIPRGDKYYRCIYSYEFSDNHVYVGLTNDLERRKNDRRKDKKDAVTIHILNNDIIPKILKLTEYLPINEAIEMEKYFYDKYLGEGWNLLNRVKTGGLGGSKFS